MYVFLQNLMPSIGAVSGAVLSVKYGAVEKQKASKSDDFKA